MFQTYPPAARAVIKQTQTVGSPFREILVTLGDFHVTTGKPDEAGILYKQALDIA